MARRRTELVKADADTDLLPRVPEAGRIEIMEQQEGHGFGGELAERPEDVLASPPDTRDISAELAAPPRRKLPWLTLLLSACVVAAGAFAGGALVEKNHLNGSSGGAARAFQQAVAGRAGGSTAGTGGRTFGGAGGTGTGTGTATGGAGGGTASGVTAGTIKLVDGSTIYVTDAQGNIVKVTTKGTTKVSESKDGKVGDLKPGQSVTVRGTANSSGDIAASTVTEGALPTGGSGGGFGGFGGGTAGGTGGATAGGSQG